MTVPQAGSRLSHLDWLEAEAIHILREGAAEGRNPLMLFSAGKDSTDLAHLALRAFYPSSPPISLLHVEATWEFRSLLVLADDFAEQRGFELLVYTKEAGRSAGLNPIVHGEACNSAMREGAAGLMPGL